MTERERAVNQRLRALDEAHLMGRITRDDYRARRRQLLGTLRDSNGVTARNAILPQAGGGRGAADRLDAPPGAALHLLFPGRRMTPWMVAAVVLVLLGLVLYWWLG